MRSTTLGMAVFLVLVISMSGVAADPAPEGMTAERLLGHIRTLASDDFEGRAPGSPGEERSVAYLVEQFRRMGLKPGNPDGRFVQDVPLVGFQARATSG